MGGRLACMVLALSMLLALPSCKGDAGVEFPPQEETVRAAAEELGWTLAPEVTQDAPEDRVIYVIDTGDQTQVSVTCGQAEGKRVLNVVTLATMLPDKPEFAWADWEKAVTLAESLYGFDEGALYQALSQQEMPERRIPEAGPDTPTGRESLSWEAEFPAGYARARWLISAGTTEHTFPEPVIYNWMETFSVILYDSKDAYESLSAN